MKDMFYLAWRYVLYHRWKTLILVLAITLVVFLPAALNVLIERSAQQLTGRAENTPLLLGAKGSPLELALSSLYFDADTPSLARFTDAPAVTASSAQHWTILRFANCSMLQAGRWRCSAKL
jgi:putative ABC transport system permease protein